MAQILLLSEDPELRRTLPPLLRGAGFDPVRADARGVTPEIVLLDGAIRRRSALERCRSARERGALIGRVERDARAPMRAAALAVPADARIAHPVKPEPLYAVLRALVRRRRAHPAAQSLARHWPPGLDTLQDGVCLRDHERGVLRCNRTFASLLGSTVLATEGRRLPLEELASTDSSRRHVVLGGRPCDLSLEPVPDGAGGIAGTILVLADRTEREQAAAMHAQVRAERRAMERMRDDFLSVAAHELRTPLTTLQLQIQTLLRRVQRASPDVGRLPERLARLEPPVERLVRLVDRMLEAAGLDATEIALTREELDLGELVRSVVTRHQARIARSGSETRVTGEGATRGRWDRARLEQVVTNLLDNALAFGRGRPIELRVDRVGSLARLEVRDHGPGIAPEDQSRIFDRFERAVSDPLQSGFGIGLWSARRIVEAMAGDIRVRSIPGAGSVFTVELPASESPSP